MAPTTEETAATLQSAAAAHAQAQAAHDAAVTASAGTRATELVLSDLLNGIVMRLGNRPDLRALAAEFKAATVKPE